MEISQHHVIAHTYRYVLKNALPLTVSLWPFSLAIALVGQLLDRTVSHWVFQIAGYGFALIVTTLCSTKAAAVVARHVLQQRESAWPHLLQLDDGEWWLFRKYLLFLLVLLGAVGATAIIILAAFLFLYALFGGTEHVFSVAQFGPLIMFLPLTYCFVTWSFLLPPVALVEEGGLSRSAARARGRR